MIHALYVNDNIVIRSAWNGFMNVLWKKIYLVLTILGVIISIR
jgi:hypothetical protein